MQIYVHTISTVMPLISIVTFTSIIVDTICAVAMHARLIGTVIDICNTKIFEYKRKCAFSKCSYVYLMIVRMKQKRLKLIWAIY